MREKYWKEQIAKKDEEIRDLHKQVAEGSYYKGLYIGMRDALAPAKDDTFEDILIEE